MTSTLNRCDCGNVVGEQVEEVTLIRHRGRVWFGRQYGLVCEVCGKLTLSEEGKAYAENLYLLLE